MKTTRVMEFVREGLRNIVRHKLRSGLTLLGVVFGIAAVIAMLGIGEGAQRSVLREISGLGLRNIIAESAKPRQRMQTSSAMTERLNYGLTFRDRAQLESACPDSKITYAAMVNELIHYRGRKITGEALGVLPEYFEMNNSEVEAGQILSPLHNKAGHRVVVINQSMQEAMHVLGDGVDEQVKIGQSYFTIIGVVRTPAHQGRLMIYMPYQTAKRTFGLVQIQQSAGATEWSRVELGQILIEVEDEEMVEPVADLVRHTLEKNHPNGDFKLVVPLSILESKQRTQRVMNLVLVTIAAISLIVGGIGIMNIMLASVTERIPEIGIRRALGATRRDILLQFIAETTTLTVIGGVLGCIVGVVTVPIVSIWTGWDGVVTPGAVLISLLVSLAVGLIFGIAPAVNAARKDPGVALNH